MENNSAPKKTGDSDVITRDYFDSLLIQPRFLHEARPTTEVVLFGAKLATPIMTGALSRLASLRPNGAIEMAEAIKAVNSVLWVGTGNENDLKAITNTGARVIEVIKPFADKGVLFQRIAHARQSGVFAIGMDVDHAFDAWKEHKMSSKTLTDLRDIVRAAEVPFIVKGVLSVQDARISVEAGAKAIVLSHHHGKMAYTVPPLRVLPHIANEVGKDITIIVDSGILSGMDVFKALALGGNAVCIGRPFLPILKNEGGEGIQKKITEMTLELALIMAKTGSPDIDHIDPGVVMQRPFFHSDFQ